MKFRRIFKRLNDKQIDRYLDKLNNREIIKTINKFGDIDYPSKLIKPLIKKSPSLLKLVFHFWLNHVFILKMAAVEARNNPLPHILWVLMVPLP